MLENAHGFFLTHLGSVQEELGASCFHFSWINDKPATVHAEVTGKRMPLEADGAVLFDHGIGTSKNYDAVYPSPSMFLRRILADGTIVEPLLQPPVRAIFISHEHIDHMDGLIYAIQQNYIMPPIYLSVTAREDLLQKLKDAGVEKEKIDRLDLRLLEPGQWIKEGPFEILPHKIVHSVIESYAFGIGAPNKAAVVYMGDGKYDPTALGENFDPEAMKKAMEERGYQVGCVMEESTNGPANILEKEQVTEAQVREHMRKIIEQHPTDDIVVSFWSRNDQRRATTESLAGELGRICETLGQAHIVRGRNFKKAYKATKRPEFDSKSRATAGFFASSSEERRMRFHAKGIYSIIKATGPNAERRSAMRRSAMVKASQGTNVVKLNPKGKVFIISATILEKNLDAIADMIAGLIAHKAERIYVPGHAYHESTKRVRKAIQRKLLDRGIPENKIDKIVVFEPKLHASGHADYIFLKKIQEAFRKAFVFCMHGPYANVMDTIRMLRRNAEKHGHEGRVMDMMPAGNVLKIPAPKTFRGQIHISEPINIRVLPNNYFEGVTITGQGKGTRMHYTTGLSPDGRPVHPMKTHLDALVKRGPNQEIIVGGIEKSMAHQEITVGEDVTILSPPDRHIGIRQRPQARVLEAAT